MTVWGSSSLYEAVKHLRIPEVYSGKLPPQWWSAKAELFKREHRKAELWPQFKKQITLQRILLLWELIEWYSVHPDSLGELSSQRLVSSCTQTLSSGPKVQCQDVAIKISCWLLKWRLELLTWEIKGSRLSQLVDRLWLSSPFNN